MRRYLGWQGINAALMDNMYFILIFIFCGLATIYSASLCPEQGWYHSELNTCYWMITIDAEPSTSHYYCQLSGGELAVLPNQTAYDWLQSNIAASISSITDIFWIGKTDSNTEGVFQTFENQPYSWASWASNQPSDTGSLGRDCVYVDTSTAWTMYDESCTMQMPGLCSLVLNYCPTGSYYLPNDLICYWITPPPILGADGNDALCASDDGNLAVIPSASVDNEFDSLPLSNLLSGIDYAYIGVHDKSIEGVEMTYQNVPITWTKWKSGEPNDPNFASFPSQDCVMISVADNREWMDVTCTNKYRGLCYRDLQNFEASTVTYPTFEAETTTTMGVTTETTTTLGVTTETTTTIGVTTESTTTMDVTTESTTTMDVTTESTTTMDVTTKSTTTTTTGLDTTTGSFTTSTPDTTVTQDTTTTPRATTPDSTAPLTTTTPDTTSTEITKTSITSTTPDSTTNPDSSTTTITSTTPDTTTSPDTTTNLDATTTYTTNPQTAQNSVIVDTTTTTIKSVSTSTTTDKSGTTIIQTVSDQTSGNTELCTCPCEEKVSLEEIQRQIEQIRKELTVDKKSTSSYLRTKTSVYEDRPVAQNLGYFGVTVLCVVFGLIVLLDAGTLFQQLKRCIQIKPR